MRALWSGVLSFGLINIPIKLYSATAGVKVELNYLHKTDFSPIRYAKVCRKDGKELTQDDLVKGYQYEDGDYVVLTDADLKSINASRSDSIEVIDFVKETEIDTIFFEKPFYLEPDKGAGKAYALLRESLIKSKKVGIVKFVIHNKEHLGIVKPHDYLLVLEQMRFEDELKAPEKLNLPKHESFRAKELTMATSFIDHLTTHFDATDYKDTYHNQFERLIKQKLKGKLPKIRKVEKPQATKSSDLMALLKESLENAKRQPTVLHA